MARGENAERRGHHREYWSRRPGGLAMSWGRPAKQRTHRAERRQAKALVAAAIVAALAGCTTLDAGLGVAERASEELTVRSLSWICDRMSVRQWRESMARSRDSYTGWVMLCGQATSVPPLPPEPPGKEM